MVALEDQWDFAIIRGSLYTLGPHIDRLGSELQALVPSREAVACRELRDGKDHFHITIVHRTSVVEVSQFTKKEMGGQRPMAVISNKRARAMELLQRVCAVREHDIMPVVLCRPVPLYVYETHGDSAATAVAVLFIPGEVVLIEGGYPSAVFHVTLGFLGTDERDPKARRLESVKVLHFCRTGSEVVELLEALMTMMRKAPPRSPLAERLGQLMHDLLDLIDHMERSGVEASLMPADRVRVSLACSLLTYQSNDYKASVTHAEEALVVARELGKTPELVVRACRRATVALAALGDWSKVQTYAEEGLLIKADDQHLRQLWRQALDHSLDQNAGVTRYRLTLYGVQLPRNFSWVVPWSLGGMSLPTGPEQIDALSRMGVRLIVSIYDQPCIPPEWLALLPEERRPKCLFLEVPNLAAPTVNQAEQFMQAVTDMEEGGSVVVHCGGGKGRAGTLLAIAMMARGMGQWTEVLTKLRTMRPGSIESSQQEAFLRDWQKGKAAQVHGEDDLEAPADGDEHKGLPLVDTAMNTPGVPASHSITTTARVFLLVGLPCSGKSTLARMLSTLTRGAATSVSQDEAGSKSAFLSRARDLLVASRGRGTSALVILDRCHASADARAEVLEELGLSHKQVEVIELRSDVDVCVDRMLRRAGHATLHFSSNKPAEVERAWKVVRSFVSRLSFPSASSDEGFKSVLVAPSKAEDLPAFVCRLLGRADVSNDEITSLLQEDLAVHTRSLPPGQGGGGGGGGGGGAGEVVPLRKFPRTRYLSAQGSAVGRDDLVLGPEQRAAFLNGRNVITVEEKLDGANLGISLDPVTQELRFQNRSHFVSCETAPQFGPLARWVESHRADLYRLLLSTPGSDLVLYGEWLFARHTVAYMCLPDLFILFDIYDASRAVFLSSDIRDQLIARHTEADSIIVAPRVARRPLNGLEDVLELMDGQSRFGGQQERQSGDGGSSSVVVMKMMEGVVLRLEEGGVLRERAKMVRPEFLETLGDEKLPQHWSKRKLVRNTLRRPGDT